jgi:hypothetical protein
MTQEIDTTPTETTPTLQEVDERWTIPWAVVEEDSREASPEAQLTWHGLSATFSHGGHDIERSMLFSAEGRTGESETSCIDTTLPVGDEDFGGAEPLAHWASYASLTPVQRANYLGWLASGRPQPLEDMNYAFLFLYGLERYALIDKGDPEDVLRVLMRLLKHYETSLSFFSAASRLAAFLFATKGIEKLKPTWFKRLFMQRAVPLHADSLAVALTWLHEREKPLPADLAFEIARQDIRCAHSDDFVEDPAGFETRFKSAYKESHGDGLALTAAEKPQTWKYRPINPSLQSWQHFASLWSVTSADVIGDYQQFAPLIDLWMECQPEKSTPSPWTSLIDKHANSDGRVLVPLSRLAKVAGLERTPSKNLDLAESLAVVKHAQERGFELLPNPAILLRPYKAKERVALIRTATCHPESEPYYLAGVLLLALGTAIAEVDGEVDHVEALHVSEIVNSLYHFNDHDKQRLGALRRRLIKFPPKLSSLTRRVRAVLTEEELGEIGKFLVGVAGANFHIRDDEALALRRAYRAFGIPVAKLDALLDKLVVRNLPEDGDPSINRKVLARYMRETKGFALTLGIAMQEVLPLEGEMAGKRGVWYARTHANHPEASIEVESRKPDPYCDALYALVQRGDWTEAEFVALGQKHGVYVEGGVAAMTDWGADTEEGSGDGDKMILAIGEQDEEAED